MPHDLLLFDANARRQHLLQIALPYVESLKSRPHLVGILLYGSLVRGGITPFSDIDMALFYEGDPPNRFEFRRAEGEKVDLISFPLEAVTKLLNPLPRSMDAGFPFSYVLESLLLSGEDSILFDPTDELLRVKTRLKEEVSFAALNRVSLNKGYHAFYRPNYDTACSLLEQGDATGALEKAKWCGGALGILLKEHTRLKDPQEAADRLGIPDYATRRKALASLAAPTDEQAEAVRAATQTLWDFTLGRAAEPLKERLQSQGAGDTGRLELIGNYDLFWPGDILYEFGRLMEEVPYALRRCRYDFDQGKGAESLQHLWGCRGTKGVKHRWERLGAALKGMGYDGDSVIEPMLESAEFIRLGERLEQAMKATETQEVNPETARRALALVGEMERLLVKVLPLMSQEELAEWEKLLEEPVH
jgi:predicted nucleotidyltransferase